MRDQKRRDAIEQVRKRKRDILNLACGSPFVQLLDKPRRLQFLNQTQITKLFGSAVAAFDVRALQSFRVVVLQIFADQRFGLFLGGFDEMRRFSEGADDFGDVGATSLTFFSFASLAGLDWLPLSVRLSEGSFNLVDVR